MSALYGCKMQPRRPAKSDGGCVVRENQETLHFQCNKSKKRKTEFKAALLCLKTSLVVRFGFYGISTIVGYLMPNVIYKYI